MTAEKMCAQKLNELLSDGSFKEIGEQNPKIKQIKKLIANTKPNPEKLFIAEGLWIFKKLAEFDIEVTSVFICPDAVYTLDAVTALEEVLKKTEERYIISAKTFAKISEKDKPDGLMCIAKLPFYDIEKFSPENNSIILVLDGIEIPGNIGTMLRMADGSGLDAVFICNRKARLTHPKLIKGSMGAVLTVPIYVFDDIAECAKWLRDNGFSVYLADTRAKTCYFDEQYTPKTAFVMGSERYGISREWYTPDVNLISIPMVGKCDSLNVGVAATVLSYDAAMKIKHGRKNI